MKIEYHNACSPGLCPFLSIPGLPALVLCQADPETSATVFHLSYGMPVSTIQGEDTLFFTFAGYNGCPESERIG